MGELLLCDEQLTLFDELLHLMFELLVFLSRVPTPRTGLLVTVK